MVLRTIEGHLLRPEDARYWWHPWREDMPAPPVEALEPPAGTWSSRPWRAGPHRVAWKTLDGSRHHEDVWVKVRLDLSLAFHDSHGHYHATSSITNARWYRYPEPPEPPEPPEFP